MSYEHVICEKRDHKAYVTLNRPQVLNAIHMPMCEEMSKMWDDLEQDEDVRVVILTGAGDRAFCAGNDLKWAAAHPDILNAHPVEWGGFGGLVNRTTMLKPIIAAVNGFAMGGGLELALACDVLVASQDAMFALSEPKWGRVPGSGLQQLPRQVPLKVAMGMILTGRRINANEACGLGLANQVVSPEQVMPEAERWANEMLECAPLAVMACKQAVQEGLGHPLQEALVTPYDMVEKVIRSEDRLEGALAFSEKRAPVWRGR